MKIIMRRFSLLYLAIILLCMEDAQAKDSHTFRFVFMTDIHVQPEQRAAEGFKLALDRVNLANPDFVLTGGDMIMDALGVGVNRADSLFDLYLNLVQFLKMPVYNTIGNHEVFGLYEDSGVSPDFPLYGKKMYLERFAINNTYYSFDYGGWHFIVLDAIALSPERRYYGFIDSLQLNWIEQDLKKINKKIPVAITTHIPFISVFGQMKNGSTYGFTKGEVIINSQQVLDKFKDHRLKLVLQGHLHCVEDIFYKDTHFITGGAVCGAWWQGARDGFPEGFVVIDVNEANFSWKYETFDWHAEKGAK